MTPSSLPSTSSALASTKHTTDHHAVRRTPVTSTSSYYKIFEANIIKLPVHLDADKLNYSNWSELFKDHLEGFKAKPKTSRDEWEILEKIFTDNKRSKTAELVGELRGLDIGDLTVDAYFRFMDSSHSSARSVVSHNSVSSDVAVGSSVPSGTVLNAFAEEIVAYEKDSNETHVVKRAVSTGLPSLLHRASD
ncbi:hypothetical protein Tco_1030332 [Tanacetum coccineum]|uniref:Retrotransposon gag domain-containing protein n=1 Tax=Tanacetum coccineum TaxID=301880 RepID=A0ABQ5G678_9ASTR